MEYLIKPNSEGLFVEKGSRQVMMSSWTIAKAFGKSHSEVIEDIDNLIKELAKNDISDDFAEENLVPSTHKDNTGKDKPCYNVTSCGFSMYMMPDNFCIFINEHPEMRATVEKYLMAFIEMETYVSKFYDCYEEFPEYAEAIKEHYEREGKMPEYAFDNEADMINRIVLGVTAEEFKDSNRIDEYARSILPYLGKKQANMIKLLRSMGIAYLEMDLPYKERKKKLESYAKRKGWNIGARMILKVGG